jgi:hypothetical protein
MPTTEAGDGGGGSASTLLPPLQADRPATASTVAMA